MPKSILPRAHSSLGLRGRVVCQARPGAVLGFVAISRRVSPGRLTEYAWDTLIQWAMYRANNKNIQLATRQCPPRTGAAFFSDFYSLNGPVLGISYDGACLQFATGDPAMAGTVMSGVIWTECLVPPVLWCGEASHGLGRGQGGRGPPHLGD